MRQHRDLLIVLLLGLTPLLWFKGQLILGGDFFVPVDPSTQLLSGIYTWDGRGFWASLGTMAIGGVNLLFPHLSFWLVLESAGMPLQAIEALWLVALFALPGISMYCLVSVIERRENRVFRVASAVAYMFSLYTLSMSTNPVALLLLGVSPLLLALFIRGLAVNGNRVRLPIVIGLVSLLGVYVGVNPPSYVVLWMPVVAYVLYTLLVSKRRKYVLAFTGRSLLAVVFLNLFWIVPYAASIAGQPEAVAAETDVGWTGWTGVNATLQNVFRLLGSWAWNRGAFGSAYFPFAEQYEQPWFIVATFFVPFMACVGLLFWKRNRLIPFCGLLGVIGLFLAKGGNPPGGQLYVWMYEHVPLFWIFRESYHFVPLVVLALCVLFGYSVERVHSWLITSLRTEKHVKRLLSASYIASVFVVVFANGWPLVTGDVVPGDRGYFPGQRTEIPAYWFEFEEYASDLPESGRWLLLPRDPFYQVHYFWSDDGYYGIDPAPYLTSVSIVSMTPGGGYVKSPFSDELLGLMYAEVGEGDTDTLTKYIQMMNIQYVVQRNDLDWTQIGSDNVESRGILAALPAR
jgi:hypothetical protein